MITPMPSSPNLKDEVLNKIRTGNVQMKPKAYFVFKILLVAFVAALMVIVAAWIVSFIVFSLRVSERVVLLGFGWRGIESFFWLFPWRLFLIEIVLIVLLNWLLHHFRFSYRSPLLYSLTGGILLSGVIAIVMNSGSLQENLFQRYQQNNLPLIGGMYEKIMKPDDKPEILRGMIVDIQHDSLLIKNTDEETALIKVLLPEAAMLNQIFNVGDEVFVAGDLVEDTLHAYGIKKVIHFHPNFSHP